MHSHSSTDKPPPPVSASDDAPPRILLVDDNPMNLQVLSGTLQGQGYTLLVARSGEQALRIARKARPAVILLDIMMPGMDGYETCARLKADERTHDSAVIFLSALQDTEDKVRGLALGAVDFITKPFAPDEVVARVQRQLALYRKFQAIAEQNRRLSGRIEAIDRAGQEPAADRSAWIESLIRSGENDRVEFKSTLRWNLKMDRADKAIDMAWLKTLVAFLNTDGGVLICGVQDDGSLLGIEADRFDNDDRYLLHVNNRIKQHIGLEHASQIRFGIESAVGGKILLVECQPSSTPAFLRDGDKEDFYVRVGPSSRRLSTREVLSYLSNRKGD